MEAKPRTSKRTDKPLAPPLRTKDVVERAGIDRETLRFYEKKGLLPDPPRSAAGYRRYDAETVERIAIIRAAKSAGFSLEEIKGLFALRVEGAGSLAVLRELGRRKLSELAERRAAIALMEATLHSALEALEQQLPASGCRIVHAYRQVSSAGARSERGRS